MIGLLAKLLGALNSDTNPSQLGLAVMFALLVGFNGFISVPGLVVLFLLFVIRCNLTLFLAMSAVFGVLGIIVSPVSHAIGESLLTTSSLQPLFTELYQTYWFRLDQLNNTVQLGDLVISVIASIPIYILSLFLINKYRKSFKAFVNKFKVVQTLKASKFYRLYEVYQGQ